MSTKVIGPIPVGYNGISIDPGFMGFRVQRLIYVYDTTIPFSIGTTLGLTFEAYVDDGSVLFGVARQDLISFEIKNMTDWWRTNHAAPKVGESTQERERMAADENARTLEQMLRSVVPVVSSRAPFPPLRMLHHAYKYTSFRAEGPVPIDPKCLKDHQLSDRLSMVAVGTLMPQLIEKLARKHLKPGFFPVRNIVGMHRHA